MRILFCHLIILSYISYDDLIIRAAKNFEVVRVAAWEYRDDNCITVHVVRINRYIFLLEFKRLTSHKNVNISTEQYAQINITQNYTHCIPLLIYIKYSYLYFDKVHNIKKYSVTFIVHFYIEINHFNWIIMKSKGK